METMTVLRLSTLGHPQRLAIFRLLVRRYPDTVSAGEIAAVLGIKPSTLSAYLAALMRAGLVTQRRVATSLRYSIDMAEARRTFDYLLLDCCRGRPDLCAPMPMILDRGLEPEPRRRASVLFLCTGNSARSILAEAILRKEAGDRFDAHSAGIAPRRAPNPLALEVLAQAGHDVTMLRSKSLAEYRRDGAPIFDFVFTVCDQAANEECPAWTGRPISAHWGMPGPVRATGTDADRRLAFRRTHDALRARILAFTALPLDTLDRISLQHAVDDIGRTVLGEPA